MATLILHPGKEKSVLRRHPWLFSGAIAQLDGRARPGDTVDVVSHEGRPRARAAWSPASQIRARDWSFDPRTDVAVLSAQPGDRETYVSGLDTDGHYLYVSSASSTLTAHLGSLAAAIAARVAAYAGAASLDQG